MNYDQMIENITNPNDQFNIYFPLLKREEYQIFKFGGYQNNEFYNNYINDNILDIKEDVDKNISENVDKNISNDKNNIQNIKGSVKNNNMIFNIFKDKYKKNQPVLISRLKTIFKDTINIFKEEFTDKDKNTLLKKKESIEDFIKENSNNENYICSNAKLDKMDEFIVQFVKNNKNEIADTLTILKITIEELKTIIKGLLQQFDIVDNNKYSEKTTRYNIEYQRIGEYVKFIIKKNNKLKGKENILYTMFRYIHTNTNNFTTNLQQYGSYFKLQYAENNQIRNRQLDRQKPYDLNNQAKIYLYNIYYPNSNVSRYQDLQESYKKLSKGERQAFDNFSKPCLWLFQNKIHEDLITKKPGHYESYLKEEKDYFFYKYIKMLLDYFKTKIELYDDDNKIELYNNSVNINTNNLREEQKKRNR